MITPIQGWKTPAFKKLSQSVDRLLGEKTGKQFAKLQVNTVSDLMHHIPRRYVSGTELSDLSKLKVGEEVAVMAEVVSCRVIGPKAQPEPNGRSPWGGKGKGGPRQRIEAVITDHQGYLTLAFFGPAHLINWWESQLEPGARGIFAGKVGEFRDQPQLAHPDFVIINADGQITGGAERNRVIAAVSQTANLFGLYPATGTLRTWTIAECASLTLDDLGSIADPLPVWIRSAADVVDLGTAFVDIHRPKTREQAQLGIDRLRFDEAFALQLTMARRRADAAKYASLPRPRKSGGLLDAFDARLPFTLTQGQQEISEEIFAEIARPHPMQRLLQGEVGSGKTIVALRAMLAVVESGGQAALLAPTEVLAAQHFATITALLGELAEAGTLSAAEHATRVVLLTGSMNAAAKREATLRAASGEAGIVIGTHALLSESVQFAELGLVVVDEQHRFGVEQRAALNAKASAKPHVLVMTATPIPRSVAMTVFGDLATSTLREIPSGRADVQTVVVNTKWKPAWVDRAWARIVEEVGQGRQAYVVCARISAGDKPGGEENLDDSDALEPAIAVTDLYEELASGPLRELKVEMLHGQLPGEEKDAVMKRFSAGETDVVVATTVVEVGVDVPNASVMVICDADRFGISQLHQLRGRIGRGQHPGVCLLLSKAGDESIAGERLAAVAGTRDGFVLADVDLEQRREGNVLGSSQSGSRSGLRLLRVLTDADLIQQARDLAERAIAEDPELDDPGLNDIVTQMEIIAAGEWLERT